MKPEATSSWSRRSDRMPVTITSETRSPASITALALRPTSVPADGGAEHVAGRQLDHPALGLQPARLSSLTRPRGTQQNDVHRARPPFSLAFLMRSPYWWAMRWLWICVTVSIVTLTTISRLLPPRKNGMPARAIRYSGMEQTHTKKEEGEV